MLDGAPGSGWQEDDDDGGASGAAAAPPALPAVRDRSALRGAPRRQAQSAEPPWRPTALQRLREARWSLAPSAAAGALLVVAAVVVLLVLSAATSGGASVPTPTPGVAVPARTPAGASSSSSVSSASGVPVASPSPGGAASGGAEVVVDVVGQVARPGLVRLPAGARADDAVRAAGGARPDADLRRVNLARVLVDGEQLVVPAPGEALPSPTSAPAATAATGAAGAAGGAGSAGGRAASGPVDLNSATLADLDALPGVGPVLAQRVLDWRAQHGRFSTVEELGEVPGFGPAALARLTPLLVV